MAKGKRRTVADIRRQESDAAADYIAGRAAAIIRDGDEAAPATIRARIIALADDVRARIHETKEIGGRHG